MPELAFRNDENELVHQIHKLWDEAEQFSRDAQAKYKAKRIRIGEALLEAKRRCEQGDFGAIAWWDWYKRNFERSRQDAHQLMSIAASQNPEAAHEAKKEIARAGMEKLRESRKSDVINNRDVNYKSSTKPDLKVVAAATPPDPIVDFTWCEDWLRQFSRQNMATQRHAIAGLRKAYREGWK